MKVLNTTKLDVQSLRITENNPATTEPALGGDSFTVVPAPTLPVSTTSSSVVSGIFSYVTNNTSENQFVVLLQIEGNVDVPTSDLMQVALHLERAKERASAGKNPNYYLEEARRSADLAGVEIPKEIITELLAEFHSNAIDYNLKSAGKEASSGENQYIFNDCLEAAQRSARITGVEIPQATIDALRIEFHTNAVDYNLKQAEAHALFGETQKFSFEYSLAEAQKSAEIAGVEIPEQTIEALRELLQTNAAKKAGSH